MKRLIIENWRRAQNADALKYFAQLVEDLLFDYNFSSYKVKMLNTHYLCKEFVLYYPLIKNKTIHEKAYHAIIEELSLSLKTDIVAKEIFGGMYNRYLGELKKNIDDIDKLYKTIKLIDEVLDSKYLKYLIGNITRSVLSNTKEKKTIRSATQSYLSELINGGYSKRYIYAVSNNLFFNVHKKVDSTEIIHEFFNHFDLKTHKYSILFKVKRKQPLNQALQKTAFRVHEEFPNNYLYHKQYAQEGYIYIEAPDIIAHDLFSAKERAASLISIFEAFIRYYYHQYEINIDKKALVMDQETSKVYHVTEETAGILKQPDKYIETISENMEKTFKILMNLESSNEFIWALKSHADATRTDNINHQFITLWSAIESLVNTVGSSKKIDVISQTLEPLFILNYFYRYTANLHNYLKKNYAQSYLTILGKVDGGNNSHYKLILLLADKEKNEPLRDELYAVVQEKNPILVNKIFYLMETLNNTDKLLDVINKHVNYIRWQIRRIYRARNVIVHGNTIPPYLNSLIENLHEYFDRILDTIMRTSEKNPALSDVDTILYYLRITAENYLIRLKENAGVSINKDNYEKFILHEF